MKMAALWTPRRILKSIVAKYGRPLSVADPMNFAFGKAIFVYGRHDATNTLHGRPLAIADGY